MIDDEDMIEDQLGEELEVDIDEEEIENQVSILKAKVGFYPSRKEVFKEE